jgi:uncharacterized LabA/DUF88 family protein
MPEQTTYLFIDGAYAREIYRQAMEAVFDIAAEPDPRRVIETGPGPYFRVYFYDCRDERRKDQESDADYKNRTGELKTYLAEIGALSGVHVRLGTITGRKRRQKEVDILLAVDMLTHGFNRNMTHAVLLAGDLDFRPVVQALVRSGVFVQVLYERGSGSSRLHGAADYGIELNWHMLYNWGRESFRSANPLPKVTRRAPESFSQALQSGIIRQPGTGRNSPALLLNSGGMWQIFIENWDGDRHAISHRDSKVLERYISKLFAPIEWTGLPRVE